MGSNMTCITSSHHVANMASYAISSRLILVIHDNMIIGTNHIVLACLYRHFEVPRMQENHIPK
jgi:hypothetical protein